MPNEYNRTFSLSLPNKSSVWVLCDRFIKEEALAKLSFMKAAMGGGSPEANKSRSKERETANATKCLMDKMSNTQNVSK